MIRRDFARPKPIPSDADRPLDPPSTPSRVRRLALPFRSSPRTERRGHRRDVSDDSEMALLNSPDRTSFDTGRNGASNGSKLEDGKRQDAVQSDRAGFPLVDADAEGLDDSPDDSDVEDAADRTPEEDTDELLPDPQPSPSHSVVVRPRSDSTTTLRQVPKKPRWRRCFKSTRRHLRKILTPPSAALLLGLIIALSPPLKALFVEMPDLDSPTTPDGRPIFEPVLDAAAYFGAAAVPLALLVLGASFARLSVPRPLSILPWAAILSLSIAKLVVLPIIGFFVVKALMTLGWLPPQDKVLVFVVTYYATGVSATNQVAIVALILAEPGVDAAKVSANIDLLTTILVVHVSSLSSLPRYPLLRHSLMSARWGAVHLAPVSRDGRHHHGPAPGLLTLATRSDRRGDFLVY